MFSQLHKVAKQVSKKVGVRETHSPNKNQKFAHRTTDETWSSKHAVNDLEVCLKVAWTQPMWTKLGCVN